MKNFKWLVYSVLFIVAIFLMFGKRIKQFFQSIFGTKLGFDALDEGQSSLSHEKAKAIADSLYRAMFGLGTDEDQIYTLLKDLTRHDFNKVFNVFGKRRTSNTLLYGHDLDLKQWLQNELSKSELAKLLELNPNLPINEVG